MSDQSALSDEAAKEHADKYAFVRNKAMMSVGVIMWTECRRRAVALLEERDAEIQRLKESIEAERRKYFEAGRKRAISQSHSGWFESEDAAYRAYTEAAKEER